MKAQLLTALVALAFTGAAAAKDIRIGVDPTYEPFEYKTADGKLTGFSVDLANAMCEHMKAKCTFVESDWAGIIPSLNAKKYDAIISSMSITEERKKAVDFTSKYYSTPSRVIGKAGVKVNSPADMKGKKIGVLKSSTQEKFAKAHYGTAGATVTSYDNPNRTYLDLKAGRLDFIVGDTVEASLGFLKKPEGKGYEFVSPDLVDDKIFGIGAGIATRKGDKLRDEFDAAIKAMRANGTWKKINDKYFTFDVWGE